MTTKRLFHPLKWVRFMSERWVNFRERQGLRGWANYFHFHNSSQAMNKVRTHAEDRLRTHLMARHKVKDRGIGSGRFPSAHLYGRYGLYKVPTKAGWNSAHALA